MKKYEFIKDTLNKKLKVILKGFFSKEETLEYLEKYQSIVSTIDNKKDYVLSFDCLEIKVFPADATEALEHCFAMYAREGFKDIEITSGNPNSILNMQVKRIAKKANMEYTPI